MNNTIQLINVDPEAFKKELIETLLEQIASSQVINQETKTEYLTRKEAAQLLNISLPTLSEHVKSGLIPCYRIKTRILFKAHEIESSLTKLKV